MGKPIPKTLKSSMKAIKETITNFNPVAPICVHVSRTQSFRDHLYPSSSFNSVYYYSPLPAFKSPSPNTFTSYSHNRNRPLADEDSGDSSTSSSLGQNTENLENFVVHPTSTNSSSSLISSKRFFFSPSTTKSIMEEGKLYLGHRKIKSFDKLPSPEPPETLACTSAVGDVAAACFCEESIHMVMSSNDPYRDFRVSMEEMMDAHEMKEWPELQMLLHCYLRINDKKTHSIIMLAFVDLLMHFLSSKDHLHDSNNSSSVNIISTSG